MLSTIQRKILLRCHINVSNFQCIFRRFKTTHCVDSWIVPIRSTGFAEVETHFSTYIKPLDPLEHIENVMPEMHEYTDCAKAHARVSLNLALPDDSDVVLNEEFFDEFSKDIRYNPQLNIMKRQHHLVVRFIVGLQMGIIGNCRYVIYEVYCRGGGVGQILLFQVVRGFIWIYICVISSANNNTTIMYLL